MARNKRPNGLEILLTEKPPYTVKAYFLEGLRGVLLRPVVDKGLPRGFHRARWFPRPRTGSQRFKPEVDGHSPEDLLEKHQTP